MQVVIGNEQLECDDVQALLALHFAAMRNQSPPEACHVLAPEGLGGPDITLFTARDRQGRLLGVGALKRLNEGEGEIKSMRTAPDALRRGVGRAILDAVVAEARRRGYRRLSLETGNTQDFGAALKLYRKAGFKSCPPFGDYHATPFTLFLELELVCGSVPPQF